MPTSHELIDMSELNTDLDTIAAIGGYENTDAVVSDAVRELLRQRPELRLSVAVEKYRSGDVSLNRAAELAGVSAEEFKDELTERGIGRQSGFLEQEDRERLTHRQVVRHFRRGNLR